MTNKEYFVGNWKMFGDFNSFKIVKKINQFSYKFKNSKIVLCVPNTLIHFFDKKLKSKKIDLGAQNCHHNNTYGAFTGGVSAYMLKNAGAKYIILGHSENRKNGDTNFLVKKKIENSLKQNLNIIFCIGENLSERKKGRTFFILKKQIKECIEKKFNLNKIIIAYEPVWSIGTNKILDNIELKKIIKFIKNEYKKNFKLKNYPKVLYGGSVNENNIKKLSLVSLIDGFLIGGASQSSKKFIDILKNYYK